MVGEHPDDATKLNMLRSNLDLDAREAAQIQPESMEVLKSYKNLKLFIERRCSTRYPGQVVLHRGQAHVVIGISLLELGQSPVEPDYMNQSESKIMKKEISTLSAKVDRGGWGRLTQTSASDLAERGTTHKIAAFL